MFVSLLLATVGLAHQPLDEPRADRLVTTALQVWDVPGAAVVVVRRDRVLYLRAVGVRKLGAPEPVTVETLFPWASCTKGLTSTVMAQLVDSAKLDWDDPVRKHLPDFRLADPIANQAVTLRDLLCHRTGLASHDELWYRSPWPQAEIVRRAGFLPPSAPFRSQFQYQSVMATAAGLAMERATGTSWDQLTRKRLFDPLGMSTACCVTPQSPNRAMPHRPGPAGALEAIEEYQQSEPNAAGSVYGSAQDLAKWLQFQLGDGEGNGRRLVSAKNFAETHAPHVAQRLAGITAATHPDTTMMSYGLGWGIQDYRGILLRSHTGMIDGYRIQLAIAPTQGLAIGVLSNRHETRMNLALVYTLLDRVLEAPGRDWNEYLRGVMIQDRDLRRQARTEREKTRSPGKPARPLAEYVGRYEHPAYGPVAIQLVDDRLQWEWRGARSVLVWHHGEEFDLQQPFAGAETIAFSGGASGVTGLRLFDCEFAR